MMNKIVLDLETQKDFAEVGGRGNYRDLRVSVAGIYSYQDGQYRSYEEKSLAKLGELLQAADQIIGYNIKQFDYAVLQPYLNFSLSEIPTLDVLEKIEQVLGHRIRLEAVAQATLGVGKSGTGAKAVTLWRNGQIEELKNYCLDDVRLTKEIYEYARKYGKVLYQDFFDTRELIVNFPEAEARQNIARQTSLF